MKIPSSHPRMLSYEEDFWLFQKYFCLTHGIFQFGKTRETDRAPCI